MHSFAEVHTFALENKIPSMKYQYKVKNFRIFDEEGGKLDMAPITILTGCNSSGKSSLVKSMLLLNKVVDKLSHNGKLGTGLKLDFTEKPNNLLGTFENVLHRGSECRNITFEYTVPSMLLNEDVVVSMTFSRHWKLNGGELSEISISRTDGSLLFQSLPDGYGCSMVTCHQDLRRSFFRCVFISNTTRKSMILNAVRENCIDSLLSESEIAEARVNAIRKEVEEIKEYYNSNKSWLDKLLCEEDSNRFESALYSNITDEQIYKENLLYSPILSSLLVAKKENFSSIAKSIAEQGKESDVYDLALCYIESVAKGFVNSDFEEFSEYFSYIYNEFFCKVLNVDNRDYEERSAFTGIEPLEGVSSKEILKEYCGHEALSDLHNLIKLLDGLAGSKNFGEIYIREYQNWYASYFRYMNLVIHEILSYRIPTEFSYVPTSIVNIKRLYSFDEKDDMTDLFKKHILSEPEDPDYFRWGFADKWLRELKIGNKISVKAVENGTGCEVRIYQQDDNKGQLLADFGYGISQLIYLLLRIEIEANRRCRIVSGHTEFDYEKKEERELRLQYRKPLTIVLEEPEVHLHPKYQSMIADILLDAYKKFNFHFIVETHSEYLIRRSQVLVSKMGFQNNTESVEKNPFVTYYIPENSVPYSLGYRKDGKFMETFGTGFYDEASNLAFDLL